MNTFVVYLIEFFALVVILALFKFVTKILPTDYYTPAFIITIIIFAAAMTAGAVIYNKKYLIDNSGSKSDSKSGSKSDSKSDSKSGSKSDSKSDSKSETFTFEVSKGRQQCMDDVCKDSKTPGCCGTGMDGLGNTNPPEMTVGNWPYRPDSYSCTNSSEIPPVQKVDMSPDNSSPDNSSKSKPVSEMFEPDNSYKINAIKDADVIVYVKDECPACNKTKQAIKKNNISQYVTFLNALEHLDSLKSENVTGVPYIKSKYGCHQGSCEDLDELIRLLGIPLGAVTTSGESSQQVSESSQQVSESSQQVSESSQQQVSESSQQVSESSQQQVSESSQQVSESSQQVSESSQESKKIIIPYNDLFKNDYNSKKSGSRKYYTYSESFPDINNTVNMNVNGVDPDLTTCN
jgi:glutaredoxin